jgi:uncharacterized protein (DUF302 family)
MLLPLRLIPEQLTSAEYHDTPSRVSEPVSASGHEIVTRDSPWSVTDTVARILEVISGRGMKLFALIDHSGEAEATGLSLRETKVVIFGSPKVGTPVMQSTPLAALDLPLKILVWADGGQTRLSYTAPRALAARYGLSDALAAPLAGIERLAAAAVSSEAVADLLATGG